MMDRWKLALVLGAALVLPLALTSCSSDDDGGGTTGPTDTVAPYVLEMHPHNDELNVDLDEEVLVVFSEDMDPATADGQVTLEPGGVAALTWLSADSLRVEHAEWPEGTEITLSIGTGLCDLAGNALTIARTSVFYTWSSELRLLGSEPDSGATNVPTNASLLLMFSHPLDLASLQGALTIDPLPSTVTTEEVDDTSYRVSFPDGLFSGTEYTVTIDAGVHTATAPFLYLDAPATISFTTGTEADTTAPYIVTCLPERDATDVSAWTSELVITFNEPINTDEFSPTRVCAQAYLWVAGEPFWSTANTVLTIPFRTPLPAGVRMFMVMEPGDFQDMAGNGNAVADSAAFTVAGDPYHVPVVENSWIMYARDKQYTGGEKAADSDTVWIRQEDVWEDGRFDRVRYVDALGVGEDDRMHFQVSDAWLMLRGFYDRDAMEDIMFTPFVNYLPLPLTIQAWDGDTNVDAVEMAYVGHITGQENVGMSAPDEGGPALVFEGCWKVVLEYYMRLDTMLVSSGKDTLWFAPGVGAVQEFNGEVQYEEGVPAYTWNARCRPLDLNPFGE